MKLKDLFKKKVVIEKQDILLELMSEQLFDVDCTHRHEHYVLTHDNNYICMKCVCDKYMNERLKKFSIYFKPNTKYNGAIIKRRFSKMLKNENDGV